VKKNAIGKSGIEASVIGMGAWAIGGGVWWGDNNDEESIRAIHTALDKGIDWIDTAPAYNLGHSEEVVGKALQGHRQNVVLSTKCGLQWRDSNGSFHKRIEGKDFYRDLSAPGIRKDLEGSLQRLRTDYIDVYYVHWQSIEPALTPISETMEELAKLKAEGKIRAIGASNVDLFQLREYVRCGQLDAVQEKYSMLDRRLENELIPFCEANEISVQAYSPLEQGVLTGKITVESKLRAGDIRNGKKWWAPENRPLLGEMFEGWDDLEKKYGCPVGNLIIAWTTRRAKNMNVLCGARKVEHVLENVKAGEIELDAVDYERMTRDADTLIARVESLSVNS